MPTKIGIVTEEEAKTKWCPFSRPTASVDCGYVVGNRGCGDEHWTVLGATRCLGSDCMAWRWYATNIRDPDDPTSLMPSADTYGFCGLACQKGA